VQSVLPRSEADIYNRPTDVHVLEDVMRLLGVTGYDSTSYRLVLC
jgi:hypothetical protein